MSSAGKGRDPRRLFAFAGRFLGSAGRLVELGGMVLECYPMCFYAADRTLMAFLCEQGIPFSDEEFACRQTAALWERCKEISPRFGELEQEFRLLLDCEWAGLPGEKAPDLRQALDSAARLRNLVLELAPSLSPPVPTPERDVEAEPRMGGMDI